MITTPLELACKAIEIVTAIAGVPCYREDSSTYLHDSENNIFIRPYEDQVRLEESCEETSLVLRYQIWVRDGYNHGIVAQKKQVIEQAIAELFVPWGKEESLRPWLNLHPEFESPHGERGLKPVWFKKWFEEKEAAHA